VPGKFSRLDIATVDGENLVARSAAQLHAVLKSEPHDVVESGDHERLWRRDLDPLCWAVGARGVVGVDAEALTLIHAMEEFGERHKALVCVDSSGTGEARVAAVDAAGIRGGVPTVDGRVELHPGIGALPG